MKKQLKSEVCELMNNTQMHQCMKLLQHMSKKKKKLKGKHGLRISVSKPTHQYNNLFIYFNFIHFISQKLHGRFLLSRNITLIFFFIYNNYLHPLFSVLEYIKKKKKTIYKYKFTWDCNNFVKLFIFNLIEWVILGVGTVKLKHFFCFAWTQMLLRFEVKKKSNAYGLLINILKFVSQ